MRIGDVSLKLFVPLLAIVLVVVGLLGYFYSKQLQTNNKKSVSALLSSNPQIQKLIKSKEKPPLITESAGNQKTATVTGKLLKIYKVDGNSFMDLEMNKDGKTVNVNVNLGPDDFLISEHTQTYSDDASTIVDNYMNLTAGQIYQKYQDALGKNISITFLTQADPKDFSGSCDSVCLERKNMYEQYKDINTRFANFSTVESIQFKIGMVMVVSE